MKVTSKQLKSIIREELRETRDASGQKVYSTQRAAASLDKMNIALRNMDPTFKKDPDLRAKYEKALAAVSALHFAVSANVAHSFDARKASARARLEASSEKEWSPFD